MLSTFFKYSIKVKGFLTSESFSEVDQLVDQLVDSFNYLKAHLKMLHHLFKQTT